MQKLHKGKKSIFQQELERTVSQKLLLTILLGCLFFCGAIMVLNRINREYNQAEHLRAVTETFEAVVASGEAFLENPENQKRMLACIQGGLETDEIRYQISKYNSDAPVKIHAILLDASGKPVFTSFPRESMNLHRLEFDRLAAQNGREQGGGIYHTVYYFSGDTSEYVLLKSFYEKGTYVGSASLYLEGNGWRSVFSRYQYDTIITDSDSDIIYCSNTEFLKERNRNKYHPKDEGAFVWANDSRYMRAVKRLPDKGISLYSFIYFPRNGIYVAIGMGIIVLLGLIWAWICMQMVRTMARKTSGSVEMLVDELRVIREGDAAHVIRLQTGDEIEEIAEAVNRMVGSIRELNERNLELVQRNSRMEMQNLQARMNPHFIYNTLDNIRYLIVTEPAKAEELIGRFTHILRYSINSTKNRVTVREDMQYIQDYLVIQKTRFGSRFQYEIQIEEECMEKPVPRLLVQPLLENSIKYGFKKKPQIRVETKGWCRDGYLYLQVTDNGAGVPKSTLETLRNLLNEGEAASVHNGLQNMNRRIALEYGKESGLAIDSIDGEEFRVIIKLWMGDN